MAVYQDREAFIPYRLNDLVEMCLADGYLDEGDSQTFREFAHLLGHYYHFQFHRYGTNILDNYAAFNPDRDTYALHDPTASELEAMEEQVISDFRQVLERANYRELSDEMLQLALEETSLIDLKTQVDFRDFDRFLCFYRGDTFIDVEVKKWIFWKEQKRLDVLQRVVIVIRYKGVEHFKRQGINPDDLKFIPGKMYAYIYKNVPKPDLEFLFPNVKTSMTLKDRLLFGVPAIGASIPIIIKVLPQLLLIISVILYLTVGPPEGVESLRADEEEVNNITPVLLAVLSLLVALGGLAFKQYSKYQSKKLKFQKKVTDTLFFRNIATNTSVFSRLIDEAENEECKEILLVYYHLLTSSEPLTPEQLDDRIEQWMEDRFGKTIDFDIDGPLRNLEKIRGGKDNIPLMQYDDRGRCQPVSVAEAQHVIDCIWDEAFNYSKR